LTFQVLLFPYLLRFIFQNRFFSSFEKSIWFFHLKTIVVSRASFFHFSNFFLAIDVTFLWLDFLSTKRGYFYPELFSPSTPTPTFPSAVCSNLVQFTWYTHYDPSSCEKTSQPVYKFPDPNMSRPAFEIAELFVLGSNCSFLQIALGWYPVKYLRNWSANFAICFPLACKLPLSCVRFNMQISFCHFSWKLSSKNACSIFACGPISQHFKLDTSFGGRWSSASLLDSELK
jgi:hypothetical protein